MIKYSIFHDKKYRSCLSPIRQYKAAANCIGFNGQMAAAFSTPYATPIDINEGSYMLM